MSLGRRLNIPTSAINEQKSLSISANDGKQPSTQAAILPLPAEVVAQIKSSTAITNLNDVILELLKNSLDVKATKVEVTVDFRRGGCIVEDNGSGIAPREFRDDGCLGMQYCTSKHGAAAELYGGTGTFIASLAALSLLTITSHHQLHRSTNTITLHRAQVISRLLSSPAAHELGFREHGTRVTVRDLFGNMPVRVKQRVLLSEEKSKSERQWENLKGDIVGLLLAWNRPVTLRVRDAEEARNLNLSVSHTSAEKQSPASALSSMLGLLTQSSYIPSDNRSTWVPISATTPAVSIKGAISLEPAPSKYCQFISLGIEPVYAHTGHNELYDEVNRLFNLSSFGSVDDTSDIDEVERERRRKDRRYKGDGFTNRQMKGGRKGIDRWPMFCLRINIPSSPSTKTPGDRAISDESRLRSVMEVLGAMVTRWLTVHHFQPRRPRTKRPEHGPSDRATPNSTSSGAVSPSKEEEHESELQDTNQILEEQATLRFGSVVNSVVAGPRPSSRKRKRGEPKVSALAERRNSGNLPYGGAPVFNEWSRIKSSNSSFYDDLWSSKRLSAKPVSAPAGQQQPDAAQNPDVDSENGVGTFSKGAVFTTEPILPGQLNANRIPINLPMPSLMTPVEVRQSAVAEGPSPSTSTQIEGAPSDDTITWVHPTTKEVYLVNARTGAVVNNDVRRTKSGSTPAQKAAVTLPEFNKRLSMSSRTQPVLSSEHQSEWIGQFLDTWRNPIFRKSEQSIPQAVNVPENGSTETFLGQRHQCTHNGVENSAIVSGRLSKAALRDAEVIAQVDRKFILAKLGSSETSASAQTAVGSDEKQILVLIDQHAADERCRVEELLAELCTPASDANPTYRSSLGHGSQLAYTILEKPINMVVSPQEGQLFSTHAAHFADWGILYDVAPPATDKSTSSTSTRGSSQTLVVRTLPPTIAERCKVEPQLLVSLLRSEVWKLAEDPPSTRHNRVQSPPEPAAENIPTPAHTPSWLRRIGHCPQGILDMLNSRACRSAIMFNDVLSIEQCKALVKRLAECAFPFQCAHGRPSMVPLVELGRGGGIEGYEDGGNAPVFGLFGSGERAKAESYGAAFRSWRNREAAAGD